MKQKYILFMVFSLFAFKGNSQTNYAVATIPFQPFSGTLAPLSTADDKYSGVINLPFSFDFYGVTYNQALISTNGYIDFRTNLAGLDSPWSFSSTIPNAANFPVKNSILGSYEDIDNSTGVGTITYGTYGTAPYRKFVVYFYNQKHFGPQCTTTPACSFQMILNETTNVIDVQIINRSPCTAWSGGAGVIGLVNQNGTMAITPWGRNTGSWSAAQEGWRFYRPGYYPNYSFVRCDDNTDGYQAFDLSVAANDLAPTNAGAVLFYETLTDAQTASNAIPGPTAYMNISNPQTLYATVGATIKTVTLSVIDCGIDADNDGVASATEDVNNDTNLANDDTDFDSLPNYRDNDDDGDLVLTNVEYVFNKNVAVILDTDNDGIPNYLDNDDDGDGALTFREDYDGDGNPTNDDFNTNSNPDYLDFSVDLGVDNTPVIVKAIDVYPNPASDVLNIRNNSPESISLIEIYTMNGAKVKALKTNEAVTTISVSDLQAGVYFVKIEMNSQVVNYKFIKK